MEKFKPNNIDELQYRIDSLPPIVRGYMALEFTLASSVIEDATKESIQQDMAKLIKNMKPKDQAHLLTHKNWLEKREVRK